MCLDTAYFAENWKHYSKIIFKCVNSALEPIFNESLCEKSGLWVPWTVHEAHWKAETLFSQKKKKTQNVGSEKIISIQSYNKYENQSWSITSLVFGSLLVIHGKKKS